jgi:hypothetical protein
VSARSSDTLQSNLIKLITRPELTLNEYGLEILWFNQVVQYYQKFRIVVSGQSERTIRDSQSSFLRDKCPRCSIVMNIQQHNGRENRSSLLLLKLQSSELYTI